MLPGQRLVRFCDNSQAFIASTAFSMVPKAVMTMNGVSVWSVGPTASTSMPWMPGRFRN